MDTETIQELLALAAFEQAVRDAASESKDPTEGITRIVDAIDRLDKTRAAKRKGKE